MILNSKNLNDIDKMIKYGKTKGMILVEKFFPQFSLYKKLIIFNNINECNILLEEMDDIFFVRADTLIGDGIVKVAGRWANKNNVFEFVKQVNIENERAVIVYMQEHELNEEGLIYTKGAFNIQIDLNNNIYMDYVGPSFDASDITKGKATHESWKIPYHEVLFLNSKNINKYKIFEISNQAFNNCWNNRKDILLKEHPNRKEEISKLENKFQKCPIYILNMIIEEIILPVVYKQKEFANYVGNNFGIQLNINDKGKIEVYEINRPERMEKTNN